MYYGRVTQLLLVGHIVIVADSMLLYLGARHVETGSYQRKGRPLQSCWISGGRANHHLHTTGHCCPLLPTAIHCHTLPYTATRMPLLDASMISVWPCLCE